MDISLLIVVPIAGIITACWILGAAAFSKIGPGFRAPFLLSYGLGVILLEPWRIGTWQGFGMFAVMLVMLAWNAAIGCVVGGLPAALIVAVAPKVREYFRR